jgi:hypothetical protein
MTTKYTKWQKYRPNGLKIYQHLQLQDPPKFTQIGIFGLKICHLATLLLQEGQAYLGIVSYAGYSLERIAHRATLEAGQSERKQSFKFFGTENHVP